jgi:hypothetical protein
MNRRDRARRLGRTASSIIGVLLLTACGAAEAPETTPIEVAPPEEQDAAGEPATEEPAEVTESADDCEITEEDDTCDDTAPQDHDEGDAGGHATMLADAARLVGMPEDELPADVRVARRGDEQFPLTFDHVIGRRTVELDQDGMGTFVVTSLVLEQEGGSVQMPPADS